MYVLRHRLTEERNELQRMPNAAPKKLIGGEIPCEYIFTEKEKLHESSTNV